LGYLERGNALYLERGNACALNIPMHEQYPYDNLDQNNFAHVGRAIHYLSKFGIYVMEPKVFLGKLIRGITNVLCSFEDEQYPFNSVDPCLITDYPNEGIGRAM
jgi:hypothetical protein